MTEKLDPTFLFPLVFNLQILSIWILLNFDMIFGVK